MNSANHGLTISRWAVVLAGLQAGVLGTLVAISWLGATDAWQRRSFWSAANLMASTFYGETSIRDGFGRSTVAGLALYVVLYGLLGAFFAWAACGRVRGLRLLLAGVLFAVAWYYFSFGLLWRRLSPLLTLLHPERPTIVGHIFYGSVLSRFERFLAGGSSS